MYIGIIGGAGPYAGLDIHQKMLIHSEARKDQDYYPFLIASIPGEIHDRTEYLMGNSDINPGYAISSQIKMLYDAGARIFGIACNTSHAKPIWSIIENNIQVLKSAYLVNMIESTLDLVVRNNPNSRVGLLATMGTYKSEVYQEYSEKFGLKIFIPDSQSRLERIHDSIYNKDYGIKALGRLTRKSAKLIDHEIEHLKEQYQIDTLILGCTEISMIVNGIQSLNLEIVKTNEILAISLLDRFKKDINR